MNMLAKTAIAIVALGLSGALGQAQDAVDIAAAKKEGKLVWYTSTPVNIGQKIVDMFQKEHGITVEMFRSGGSAILRRFQQEIDAGRVAADVMTTSDPAAAAAMTRKGLFVPFKPKDFDKVPDAAKDPNGNYVAQRLNMMTIYLRHDKIAPADEPKTWNDVLNAKYKGVMRGLNKVRRRSTLPTHQPWCPPHSASRTPSPLPTPIAGRSCALLHCVCCPGLATSS